MSKTIYLTIDDAPSTDCINKLDFLDEHNIKAVWFAEGKRIEDFFDSAVEILKRGHIIGNHSYSHPHFSDISVDACLAEITETHDIVERVYDTANMERQYRYFRFPYGDKGNSLHGDVTSTPSADGMERHSAIQSHLTKLGYTQPTWHNINYDYMTAFGIFQDVDWFWTYDSRDWCPSFPESGCEHDTTEKVLARLDEDVPDDWRGINDHRSAEIFLIHDHVTPDQRFQKIINKLAEKPVVFALPS
jgi:peptidoglycan-N-acetylglucosamine deacetylase